MTKLQIIGLAMAVSSLALFLLLMDVHGMVLSVLKMALAPWFVCGVMMFAWK